MKTLIIAAGALAALGAAACTSTGNTERGAVSGALLGGVAGAVIGNNTGNGDAGQGAAIGAATGAIAGGVIGSQKDNDRRSVDTGPRGEPLVYDNYARRYYYVDRNNGRTYWANGDYRG